MAGKKAVTGKKETRGGSRKGSGRKKGSKQPKNYSDEVKKRFEKAAKKIKKETGKPIEEHVLRMIIDPLIQDTVRVAAVKHYLDAMVVKETKAAVDISDRNRGPHILDDEEVAAVGLPKRKADPAKVIQISENEKEEDTG